MKGGIFGTTVYIQTLPTKKVNTTEADTNGGLKCIKYTKKFKFFPYILLHLKETDVDLISSHFFI